MSAWINVHQRSFFLQKIAINREHTTVQHAENKRI